METRVLLLLVLLGGTAYSQDPHYTPGYLLMTNWLTLKDNVRRGSGEKENEPCNATAEQTYAYFLLGDLIDFHVVTGIIAYGFPRRGFYEDTFKELHRVADIDKYRKKKLQPPVVFCDYAHRLVCSVDVCVFCSSLPTDADAKLNEACALNGTGGANAPQESPKEGEVPTPEKTEKPEKECDDGWLTEEDMRAWHKTIEKDTADMRSRSSCLLNFDLQRGFYLLDDTVRKSIMSKGVYDLEEELEEYWDFYEERLWMFRGGNNTELAFCRHEKDAEGNGPWVCGMDAMCIPCEWVMNATYSANPPKELVDGCDVKGRPEKRVLGGDKCVKSTTTPTTTTTTTTTTESSFTTEESSGVGMGGSGWVLLAAAAGLLALTSLAFPPVL